MREASFRFGQLLAESLVVSVLFSPLGEEVETRDSLPVLDRIGRGKSSAKSKDPTIDGAWKAVWISLRRLIREHNTGFSPKYATETENFSKVRHTFQWEDCSYE